MASPTEQRRVLHDALMEAIGEEPSNTLMDHLPDRPTPDFATRDDVMATATVLRGEMAELRGEMTELRSELRGEMAAGFAGVERRFAEQNRFIITTFLAGNVALAVLVMTAVAIGVSLA